MTYPERPEDLSKEQVDQIIDSYLRNERWTGLTHKTYASTIDSAAEWAQARGLANVFCFDLARLEEYRDHLIGRGLSLSTVALRVPRIPALYRHAHSIGLSSIDLSVTAISTPRRTDRPATEYLESSELREIVRASALLDVQREALIRLIGLFGLQPKDVCELSVASYATTGAVPTLTVGSGDQQRRLPLDSRTSDVLTQATEGRRRGALLLNDAGNRLTRSNIKYTIKRAAALAGIERRISATQMRVTMIRHALSLGIATHNVASSVGITSLRRFEHYLPPDTPHAPEAGLAVASNLAPDPVTRLTEFAEESLATESLPAAGICAIIGLIAEALLRDVIAALGVEVRGDSGLSSLVGAILGELGPIKTLGRDVNRLAQIRNRAAHGHLHQVSLSDADEALRLLRSIRGDLGSISY